VDDEDAERSRQASQLFAAIDSPIVDVKFGGQASAGDGLTQAVQECVQSLLVIELGMGNEAAGVVQHGKQKGLHAPAARTLDIGAKQQVGLPHLVAELSFELFASGRG
jgi:hypothetical protein